ncbi:Ankyrin repeat domain-containing protein 66 [Trichoplax sp. H2]|nr:Ankyrin repeat domain-containing protein 66 [Trichoplax sp. H2]|eukprot:RDD47539.1 Ankyrin repeat domain-containing protein 66 [Trichoplax sp. H2]
MAATYYKRNIQVSEEEKVDFHVMIRQLNIHEAAFAGDYKALRKALEDGQNPAHLDHTGSTPIHKAASNGHTKCLLLLLENGSKVNQLDVNKCTPAHLAARNGHLQCIKSLYSKGADLFTKSCKGNTPKKMAKVGLHQPVVNFISRIENERIAWSI